jgi:hypothetical protein
MLTSWCLKQIKAQAHSGGGVLQCGRAGRGVHRPQGRGTDAGPALADNVVLAGLASGVRMYGLVVQCYAAPMQVAETSAAFEAPRAVQGTCG